MNTKLGMLKQAAIALCCAASAGAMPLAHADSFGIDYHSGWHGHSGYAISVGTGPGYYGYYAPGYYPRCGYYYNRCAPGYYGGYAPGFAINYYGGYYGRGGWGHEGWGGGWGGWRGGWNGGHGGWNGGHGWSGGHGGSGQGGWHGGQGGGSTGGSGGSHGGGGSNNGGGGSSGGGNWHH